MSLDSLSAKEVVALLHLQPLTGEGGMWAPVYREETGNVIFFLMEKPDFSAWHRLKESETWIHVAGAPVALHTIADQGSDGYEIHTLSRDSENVNLSYTVHPDIWMAAEPLGPWSLVSCSLTPAFSTMQLASPDQVASWVARYGPDLKRLIHG